MRCKVIFLSKKQQVPLKQLGKEWRDIAEWWPETTGLWGSKLAGKVLIDGDNKVAICGVVKFRTSLDSISMEAGLKYLEQEGYEPEIIEL